MYKWLETFIAACFYYSGLVKLVCWWKQKSRPSLVILNYHRAADGDLRRHLLYLKRHYRVLHLEAALEELYAPYKSGPQRRDRRTALVLTFDDGYSDNYTYGFLLAKELHVPITIFLVPGYIENGQRFWWQEPEYLLRHAQVDETTLEGHTYSLRKLAERKALAQAIDARVRHATTVTEREKFLTTVRELLKVQEEASCTTVHERATLPLSWAEVRKMEESGWVSFGAHTMHHPILAYLTDPAEVDYEVKECRRVLEQQLGHPVRSFAYPVGQPEHIGEQGLRAVHEAEYNWAVTAVYGFNSSQSNPHLLWRIDVDVDQHWLRIAVKACGVWGIFTRLCRIPVNFMQQYLRGNSA
ncbi:MAG: hypothetical protein NVSMB33_07550 [Ktedonobacteraceae bacterium]